MEIEHKTVWQVDGYSFDSEDEARWYVEQQDFIKMVLEVGDVTCTSQARNFAWILRRLCLGAHNPDSLKMLIKFIEGCIKYERI